jgi:hypothetical protein
VERIKRLRAASFITLVLAFAFAANARLRAESCINASTSECSYTVMECSGEGRCETERKGCEEACEDHYGGASHNQCVSEAGGTCEGECRCIPIE